MKHAALLEPDLKTEMLDLRDYEVQFCDGRNPAAYNLDTQKVMAAVLSADCFVIGTPVFQASMAAPLKKCV